MSAYAFYLDASACSGCKACQVACQDKHGLPSGVRWRRVYEVSGGGWEKQGEAWRQDAFAYQLSIACNHCAEPICVEVCPTRAMHRRADGVVLVDGERCVGCHYCEWACPYGAPQYDEQRGQMTKCTLCADELALGAPPACVAACGLRALDFGTPEELARRYAPAREGSPQPAGAPAAQQAGRGPLSGDVLAAATPPLPDPSLTRPALLLRAHPRAARLRPGEARLANLEEVRAALPRTREASLVAFTLLVQLAVGLYWAWLALCLPAGITSPGLDVLLLAVGPLLLAGTAASLLHLGRPGRAWRALANLRSSWLSRELLLTFAFAGGWLLSLILLRTTARDGGWPGLAHAAVGALGFALLYAMARVYRLRTRPAWDSRRTFHSFVLSALVTGAAAASLLLAASGRRTGRSVLLPALLGAAVGTAAILARVRFYRHARSPL